MLRSDPCLAQMEAAGFSHILDPQAVRGDEAVVRKLAVGLSNVVARTYPDGEGGTHYPLKVADPVAAEAAIRDGTLDVFAAFDSRGEVIAATSIVYPKTLINSVDHVELGRTGIDPLAVAAGYKGRGIIKERIGRLLADPRYHNRFGQIQYVDSELRTAEDWDLFPGGSGIHSVFFGGSQYPGQDLGFAITNVSRSYNLGRNEPFTHVMRPLDPAAYAEKMAAHTIVVPSSEVKGRLATLMLEGIGATPKFVVVERPESQINPEELLVVSGYDPTSPYSDNIGAKVSAIHVDPIAQGILMDQGQATGPQAVYLRDAIEDTVLGGAPYVEVQVDAVVGEQEGDLDETNLDETIGVMNTLQALGFICTGWSPSINGQTARPVLTFGALSSNRPPLAKPVYPERYYQNGRSGSRQVAMAIFDEIDAGGLRWPHAA